MVLALAACAVLLANQSLAQTLMALTPVFTNEWGEPAAFVHPGEDFFLKVFVQDIRPNPLGVFSAYVDASYNPDRAAVSGPLTFGLDYPNGHKGFTNIAGLITEAGAFDGSLPLGGASRLLFTAPMTAISPGVLKVQLSYDSHPFDELLLYDDAGEPLLPEQVSYGSASLTIVPEPATVILLGLGLAGVVCLARRKR